MTNIYVTAMSSNDYVRKKWDSKPRFKTYILKKGEKIISLFLFINLLLN